MRMSWSSGSLTLPAGPSYGAHVGESEAGRSSYDDVPYGAAAHPTTHPDRLATVATVFGATPPPVATCRVLELGCARGMNLVAMAEQLPDARFVGIDLSGRQIDEGRETVARLGLGNVDLRQASILDVDETFGEFDYVICHGVFAWVPREVQDKIFEICATRLSPDGVSQISYNTYPGWHFRGMIREMLLYHSAGLDDPLVRTAAARALLDFLAQAAGEHSPYGRILNEERALLARLPDYYVFHEHLETTNQPLWFHEFAGRAASYGLQYVGDADPPTMGHFNLPEQVQQVLRRLSGSVVQAEQYLDFLRNRTFRQSLLVREGVALSRTIDTAVLRRLRVATAARQEGGGAEPEEVTFRGGKETVTTKDPLLRAAVEYLGPLWPESVPFSAVVATVSTATGVGEETVARSLGSSFLRLYLSSGVLELHVTPPAFTTAPGEHPVASPLARLQAMEGTDVTNLRHDSVRLGEVERLVLPMLDGTRSRGGVTSALLAGRDGALISVAGGSDRKSDVAEAVERTVERLARGALLIG